jgi:Flp pilus assembly protein TadB
MDYSNDFSLYERRRLAEIERGLAQDRRLVAMMAVLGSERAKAWRRMQCLGVRVRRPVIRAESRRLRAFIVVSLCLTVAVPAVLIAGLATGVPVLAMIMVCLLPVPPAMLAVGYHKAGEPHSGRRPLTGS